MQLLRRRCAKALYENRIEMEHIKPTTSEAFIQEDLSTIMYIRVDKLGVRISGSSPSMYLKLDNGSFDIKYKSQFLRTVGINPRTGKADTEPFDWEDLKEMRITYEPLVNFYRLYSGHKTRSVQSKMKSAIVHAIMEPVINNPQEESALALASNPDYMTQMEEGLKVARERKAEREAAALSPSTGSYGEEGSSTTPVVVDPLTAASMVASATKGMTIEGTSASQPTAEGSSPVTSSFTDFMKGPLVPVLNKVPSLPTVPSVPSVSSEG